MRSLLGCGEKNKQGDLTQSPACTQGWGWRARWGSLALLWGQGTPQEQPAWQLPSPGLLRLEQGLLKCWLKVLRLLVEASTGLSKQHECAPVGDARRGQCGGCLPARQPQGCSHRPASRVSHQGSSTDPETLARVKGEKPASYKTLPSPCLNSTTAWGPTPAPSAQTQPEATSHPLPAATSACPT